MPDILNHIERMELLEKEHPEGSIVRVTKGFTIVQARVERPRGHTHVKLFGRCLHEYVEEGYTVEKVST